MQTFRWDCEKEIIVGTLNIWGLKEPGTRETFDVVFGEGWRSVTRKNVPLNELQIPNVSVADLFFSILFV